MFGFPCSRCGQLEIVHQEPDILRGNIERGLWLDREYQEGGDLTVESFEDISDWDDFVKFSQSVLRGYRFSLDNCPGFVYRKTDHRRVVLAAAGSPGHICYLPKFLQRRAEKILDARQRQEELEAHRPWYGPVHTYLFYGPGVSFVVIGE